MGVNGLDDKYIMFLRNHGTLTCGKTIHEAMFYTNHLESACKVQINALKAGLDNLIIPDKVICEKSNHDLLNFEKDIGLRDWIALKRKIIKLEMNKNKKYDDEDE